MIQFFSFAKMCLHFFNWFDARFFLNFLFLYFGILLFSLVCFIFLFPQCVLSSPLYFFLNTLFLSLSNPFASLAIYLSSFQLTFFLSISFSISFLFSLSLSLFLYLSSYCISSLSLLLLSLCV